MIDYNNKIHNNYKKYLSQTNIEIFLTDNRYLFEKIIYISASGFN